MITIQFLAEWAIRSSILILSGALLLRVLRVKDSSIRLAAWTAMLCASLAIPLLSAALPKIPVAVMQPAQSGPLLVVSLPEQGRTQEIPFDWPRAAVIAYLVVAGTLLLRLAAGLAISRRLLRSSQRTGLLSDGIDIRESDRVAAPVTLGIVRPAILLPLDWREWDAHKLDTGKLDAVLAHERSHIHRHDPAVQLLSAIHRALMWHSPLSWFLHRRIVRVAEEASDDAVVLATCDRASYAEILLDFMQRGMRGPHWHGVAMARYGRPDDRINRILDEPSLSKGMTRWGMAAILALASPLAFLIATAHPQERQRAISTTASTLPPDSHEQAAQAPQATTPPPPPAKAATTPRFRRYMIFSDDSRSGSWDSRDPVDEESLKARFGREFVWLRQGGHEYVVTDPGVLGELRQAMEPQSEVNRQQGAVNVQQGAVNVQQGEVNRVQGEVNSQQGQVNRRQEMINRLQSAKGDDDLIRKMSAALAELQAKKGGPVDQESVNSQQAHVNELQARVNEEQQKVNQQQHEVNEQQRRVSAIFNVRIDEILDSALRRNLAKQLD